MYTTVKAMNPMQVEIGITRGGIKRPTGAEQPGYFVVISPRYGTVAETTAWVKRELTRQLNITWQTPHDQIPKPEPRTELPAAKVNAKNFVDDSVSLAKSLRIRKRDGAYVVE